MARRWLREVDRAWLLLGVAVLVSLVGLASGVLTLPDWTNPTKRDYDQATALVGAGIVLAIVGYAWFARHMRRAR